MFIQSYNVETGEIDIYCTECERFINEICIDHCPVYDEKEVDDDDE